MRVSDDCKMDAKLCLEKLDRISDTFVFSKENTKPIIQPAMITLGSRILNKCQRKFAKRAVGAIISVADVERNKTDDKKAVRKSPL